MAGVAGTLCDDVRHGLRRQPPVLPSKHFYNEVGAALFDRITRLPEYYLTRTELGILRASAGELARCIGTGARIIEFGTGSGTKTRLLLQQLENPAAYVPIDISCAQLRAAAASLATEFPGVIVRPLCSDYTGDLSLPPLRGTRDLAFFPGSTIGNFESREAEAFLRRVGRLVGAGGRLLIGADLDKDASIIESAYNDDAGVTAAFNLNLLHRINRECCADIDIGAFGHRAIYDPEAMRIEMRLVCTRDTVVNLPAGDGGDDPLEVAFRAGDFIITEYSHKYRPAHFEEMAARAGWRVERFWTDERRWFGVWLLRRD